MKTLFCTIALILLVSLSFSQTQESLKKRIQEHYKAIHAKNTEALWSHHLEEFTMFPYNGHALYESGFKKTHKDMGTTLKLPSPNVVMKHFNSQIYNNVGIATFYLDGSYDGNITFGLYRVTAVWVWENGVWKEAHHHESKLEY
ncbi:nuclear transport factor 2 family protein [Aestuariivivens insulae]|uniref:nuclear transport factor 2 family protein n=1 Tax=Aestuariivivens insulae TaxID=1621988 RepID=UPI001F59F6D0|nr:nuclear transport factor 2 family protein [Aestuariivivens insulae]